MFFIFYPQSINESLSMFFILKPSSFPFRGPALLASSHPRSLAPRLEASGSWMAKHSRWKCRRDGLGARSPLGAPVPMGSHGRFSTGWSLVIKVRKCGSPLPHHLGGDFDHGKIMRLRPALVSACLHVFASPRMKL